MRELDAKKRRAHRNTEEYLRGKSLNEQRNGEVCVLARGLTLT